MDAREDVASPGMKQKIGHILWSIKELALKFGSSALDISTDVLSGCNYLNGGYNTLVYIVGNQWMEGAAGSSGVDLSEGKTYTWYGVLTLLLVWVPGLFYVPRLARQLTWRGTHWTTKLRMGAQHALLFVIWPVFTTIL